MIQPGNPDRSHAGVERVRNHRLEHARRILVDPSYWTAALANAGFDLQSVLNFIDAIPPGGGSGAPTGAEYLVGAIDAGLSAERVVTDTPSMTWDLATAGQAKANVVLGGGAGTACDDADARLSDARTPTAHTHSLADVTDAGGAAALDVGAAAGTVCAGDDSRLSDARTPTSHAHPDSEVWELVPTWTGNLAPLVTAGPDPVDLQSVLAFLDGLSLGGGVTDHGALTGLTDDDHEQYIRVDGLRAFTGTITGVAPTSDLHLSTKKYVDDGLTGLMSAAVGYFQPLDATLTALAGVATGADSISYFTGTDTAASTPLTAAGRALIDDADAAAQRMTLSAAQQQSETLVEWFDDLDFASLPNNGWTKAVSGTGADVYAGTDHVNSTENVTGEQVLALGTTSTSRAAIYRHLNGILFGAGTAYLLEWRGTCGALATVADDFKLHWGFIDNANASTEPTNGVYLRYDRSTDGDFWVFVTRDNGTETKTVSAVAPADYSTLHTFSLEVDAAGTSAVLKRDGVTLATHTANIPTAAGRRTGLGFRGNRTAYTATGRWSYVDWVHYKASRTAAR